MIRRARAILLALAAALIAAAPACAQTTSPFANWAAIVVAADWRAHGDAPSEGFDNARRDLTKAFVGAGFSSANIVQFSTKPENDPQTRPLKTEFRQVKAAFDQVASRATDGCLAYFTSHGSPMGIVFNEDLLTPAGMARLVADACGARPTVVVVSACFSGVFLPVLSGPNRMVLTAARPDRTSFGCGQTDRYPYFDACMLESLPQSPDFMALGRRAQVCVAARERAENLTPPSEPQMSVGAAMRPMLPLYAFASPPSLAAAPAR
jgi:hypothetical protein